MEEFPNRKRKSFLSRFLYIIISVIYLILLGIFVNYAINLSEKKHSNGSNNDNKNKDNKTFIERIKIKEKERSYPFPKDIHQELVNAASNLDLLGLTHNQKEYERFNYLLNLPWPAESNPKFGLTIIPKIEEVKKKIAETFVGHNAFIDSFLNKLSNLRLNSLISAAKGTNISQVSGSFRPICLYGEAGIGKTTIVETLAKALGFGFGKIFLGDSNDPTKLYGSDRLYLGSSPGQIVKILYQQGKRNPIILLDEIDKIAQVFGSQGSLISALYDILEPANNKNFHDHFLDVDFDLNHVIFIATANDVDRIPENLRNRFELIEIKDYKPEERLKILQHFIKKYQKETLQDRMLDFKIDQKVLNLINKLNKNITGVRGIQTTFMKLANFVSTFLTKPNDPDSLDDNYAECLRQKENFTIYIGGDNSNSQKKCTKHIDFNLIEKHLTN